MTRLISAISTCLLSATLLAQGDRITVRLAPRPNQTVRQRMTTEVAMTIERDTAPADATPVPPQQMKMTTTMEVTSTVGAVDSRGYYDARVVADDVALTMTLNGQPMPAPAAATAGIGGHPMIFHYDDQGRMLGVDPESPADTATAPIAQAMTGALASVAPLTLSVGETVAVPTQLKLPMPGSGPDGAMSLNGEMRFTLTSVTRDGANRIAHLATVSTIAMSRGSTDATQPQSVPDTRMTGEGSCDVDIDRGIVLHNEQRSTIDNMSGLAPGAPPAMANMRVRGTVTISVDFVK